MKRDFDAAAPTWDADEARVRMSTAIADAMLARLHFTGGETVLDYGTGTGIIALRLAPRVRRVIAADSSQGMLDVLERKVAASGVPDVTIQLLDLERQDPPATVVGLHAVVSAMALHHVRDTPAFLARVYRMLAPGGRIAIADLDTEDGDFHADNTGVEHFGFDRAALGRLIEAVGFESVLIDTAYEATRPAPGGGSKVFPIFVAVARRPDAGPAA
jgi:cyclopropane fatty-acyl-phospholipid synthase-like methyltransferase